MMDRRRFLVEKRKCLTPADFAPEAHDPSLLEITSPNSISR